MTENFEQSYFIFFFESCMEPWVTSFKIGDIYMNRLTIDEENASETVAY